MDSGIRYLMIGLDHLSSKFASFLGGYLSVDPDPLDRITGTFTPLDAKFVSVFVAILLFIVYFIIDVFSLHITRQR